LQGQGYTPTAAAKDRIKANEIFRHYLKMPLLVSKRGSEHERTNNPIVRLAVGELCKGKATHQQRLRKEVFF